MFRKFCRIDTNKPLSFHLYVHELCIYIYICTIYTVHYLYVQQVFPRIFSPIHFSSKKNPPLRNFLRKIQADGVSGVIHSATRLALQLFLNSERAGKIDKDGGRCRLVLLGGVG